MPYISLATLLGLSVAGTLLASLSSLIFRGRIFEKLSLVLLFLSSVLGAGVACTIVLGLSPTIILSLFSGKLPFLFGMVLGLDRLSAVFYFLVNIIFAVISLFILGHLDKYAYTYHVRFICFLTAFLAFGLQGTMLATTLIGYLFFIQFVTFPTFFLIMSDGTLRSRQAAMRFFIMTELGASGIVAGLFLLSQGALLADFSTLAQIAQVAPFHTLIVAAIFLIVGYAFRLGLVPLHIWLPDAFTSAPAHASALMSSVNILVTIYGFLRIALFVFGEMPLWFGLLILFFGLGSIVVGALSAAVEHELKKILAYDVLQNIGLIFSFIGLAVCLGVGGYSTMAETAFYAALMIAFVHAFAKAAFFLLSGMLTYEVHSESIESMGGLARKMPQLSILAGVLTLSAAVLPPSGTFIALWLFTEAAVLEITKAGAFFQGLLVLFFAALFFGVGFSFYNFVRFFSVIFLGRPRSVGAENAKEISRALLLPIFLLTFFTVLFGILAPDVLHILGGNRFLQNLSDNMPAIIVSKETMSPILFLLPFFGISIILGLARQMFTRPSFERMQEPWTGGHPTTMRMEYTGTAFSSAVRFFFSAVLKTQNRKAVKTTPLLSTNPWFVSKSVNMNIEPMWERVFYHPLQKSYVYLTNLVKRLQTGNVQVYVAMILVTLALCILIAL